MKHKKIMIPLLSLLAVALLAGIIRLFGRNDGIVKVYAVTDVMNYGWDESGTYGMILPGSSETYRKGETQVKEIYVTEGQNVKPGDALFQYDTRSLENAKKLAEIDLEKARLDLEQTQAELARWSKYKPYHPFEPYFKETISRIMDIDDSEKGKGTENDPFIFSCDMETIVNPRVINELFENKQYAEFQIWNGNPGADMILVFTWKVDGTKWIEKETIDLTEETKPETTPDPLETEEPGAPEPTPEPTLEPTPEPEYEPVKIMSIWEVSDGLVKNSKGKIIAYPELEFAEGTSADKNLPAVPDISESRSHTQEEIDETIRSKKQEIARQKLALKQAEIDYAKANAADSDGVVHTNCTGFVKEVHAFDDVSNGETYLFVMAESGYLVQGSIDEFNLENLKKGDTVTVNSMMTGASSEATITYIAETPSANNFGSMGDTNPNSSFYTFKAAIGNDTEITPDDWVQILFNTPSDTKMFYISKMFNRKEHGRNYVMIADESHKLKKQFIKTGKIMWGEQIQILSGLTEDDYIAFPYGKNVKEGANCDIAESLESLYGW